MAVPKKRMSGQKRRQRRSHDGLTTPAPSTCPRCSQPKRSHCVCGNCGFYKGEMIVDMKKL